MLYQSAILKKLAIVAEQSPDTILLYDDHGAMTAAQLYADALHLAQSLIHKGFMRGDRVVLAAAPDRHFLVIVYALISLQACLAIIDPEMGRDNYRSKLRQFAPLWAFVDSRLLLLQEHPILRGLYFALSKKGAYFPYTPGVRVIACGTWLPLWQRKYFYSNLMRGPRRAPTSVQWQPADEDADFLITYTSGTLSEPKGVVHSSRTLQHSLNAITGLIHSDKENLMATYLPHYMLISISVGLAAVLYRAAQPPAAKLTFFEQRGVSTVMGPPGDFLPMIRYCEDNQILMPASLQHILLGSAPVTRAFLQRLIKVVHPHTRLTCLYGMTENLLVTNIDGRFKATYDVAGDLLGDTVPGVELKIVEDEIWLKSPQLFKRYFHLTDRPEWHATGDLGTFDAAGRLLLLGRSKDMIIRRNFNIYPALYEPTINTIEGIDEAVLVGVYDDMMQDERVYLIVEGSPDLSATRIMNLLRSGPYAIDQEALPDSILFQTLPRSGRQHKVDKMALRQLLRAQFNIA